MTIFGKHTISETRELIAQKERDLNAYGIAYRKNQDTIDRHDLSWGTDFAVLVERWQDAVSKAEEFMRAAKGSLSDDMTPVEPAWNLVLTALQREPGHFQKGDFPDLINRWSVVSSEAKVSAPEIVTSQPTSRDVDLDVFKQADKATKEIESAGKTAGKSLLVIGGIALVGLIAYDKFIRH